MSRDNPWFKFYPADWRSDPALRICSLAARGLWLEMLCIMHEATPYGYLLVNGHVLTDEQLAAQVQVTASPDRIAGLLDELEKAGGVLPNQKARDLLAADGAGNKKPEKDQVR